MKKQEKNTALELEAFVKEKGVQFGKFVSGWLTPKRLFWFLLIVYLLSLVPLLWIGFYNYPSADDYSIGSDCRQAFVNTHSLLATVWAGIVRAADDWLNWMGYFTSNFLMALPPNTFGERAYVWTSVIMIGALSLSTAYLLKVIFCRVFHADKYLAGSVILLMLFITVQRMQGRVEAFYWYSGAANYILVHSFCMWFYGLLISAIYDTGKKRIRKLVGASVLGFLVGGGNQMTDLNGAVVLLAVILCVSLQKKWRTYRAFWWPIGLYYLGFLLNVAAPGNWVRAADATGMNPVKAIFVSFYYAFDYCINEWSGWPVLFLVLILIPLFYDMAGKKKFFFSMSARCDSLWVLSCGSDDDAASVCSRRHGCTASAGTDICYVYSDGDTGNRICSRMVPEKTGSKKTESAVFREYSNVYPFLPAVFCVCFGSRGYTNTPLFYFFFSYYRSCKRISKSLWRGQKGTYCDL